MVHTVGKGTGRREIARPSESMSATAPDRGRVVTERRTRPGSGGSIPRRALADGVVERRRAKAREAEVGVPHTAHLPPPGEATGELRTPELTAQEHYRLERQRRGDRLTGDLAALLAEAKAEYEAQINAPRPAGKGGRPRKKPVVVDDDDL